MNEEISVVLLNLRICESTCCQEFSGLLELTDIRLRV